MHECVCVCVCVCAHVVGEREGGRKDGGSLTTCIVNQYMGGAPYKSAKEGGGRSFECFLS